MDFNELVAFFRNIYTTYDHLDDVDFLMEMEGKLVKLSMCDDLSEKEQEMVSLLPQIREYLQ